MAGASKKLLPPPDDLGNLGGRRKALYTQATQMAALMEGDMPENLEKALNSLRKQFEDLDKREHKIKKISAGDQKERKIKNVSANILAGSETKSQPMNSNEALNQAFSSDQDVQEIQDFLDFALT